MIPNDINIYDQIRMIDDEDSRWLIATLNESFKQTSHSLEISFPVIGDVILRIALQGILNSSRETFMRLPEVQSFLKQQNPKSGRVIWSVYEDFCRRLDKTHLTLLDPMD